MRSTIFPYITTERDFSFSFGGAFKKLVDLLLSFISQADAELTSTSLLGLAMISRAFLANLRSSDSHQRST